MKLPVVSWKEIVKALAKIGFEVDHQKGSHLALRKNRPPFLRTTVPKRKGIAKGTLLAIIKQTGLDKEKFIEILKK